MANTRLTKEPLPFIKGNNEVKPDARREFDNLPDSAILRPKEISYVGSWSDATTWRLFQSGRLTRRKLGPRMTGAMVGEVRALLKGEE